MFNYLKGMGGDKKYSQSLLEKVDNRAKGHLHDKYIRNWWNNPWFYYFRKFFIRPFFLIYFIPLRAFNAIRPRTSIFPEVKEMLKSIHKYKPLSRNDKIRAALPFIKAKAKSVVEEEEIVTKTTIMTGYILWLTSLVFTLLAIQFFFFADTLGSVSMDFKKFKEGFPWKSLLLFGSFKTLTAKMLYLSFFFWLLSFGMALILDRRPWISRSEKGRLFWVARAGNTDKTAESDGVNVFSIPELIYVKAPRLNMVMAQSSYTLQWPDKFMLGEYYENPKNRGEFIFFKRPDLPPIISSGENARRSISAYSDEYDKRIISQMQADIKKKGADGVENIYLGDIIDFNWFSSTEIFVPLGNNPHFVNVGQTRSGKSKSAMTIAYSIKRAFPDTIFYFADGKGAADWVPFAEVMSPFPLAAPDPSFSDDLLLPLANVLTELFSEYKRRMEMFKAGETKCSTIYQYRKFVDPTLPQIFFIIDEFSIFLKSGIEFETNVRVEGTLAFILKTLTAAGASYGIHLIFSTQRYQTDDVPSQLRSNITARLIHNSSPQDAKGFLGLPEASSLDTGSAFCTAQGFFCKFTGINDVKVKLPYIGDEPSAFLREKCKPVPKEMKKGFDPQLIYNKGNSDIEKMSIAELAPRFEKFFRDQNYISRRLSSDLESTPVQFEVRKGNWETYKDQTGVERKKLVANEELSSWGVSLLRADEIDQETLATIQEQYTYPAVLIFIVGKAAPIKYANIIKQMNEKGTRFVIIGFREFSRALKDVTLKAKESKGEPIDIDFIMPKVMKLGASSKEYIDAAMTMNRSDIDASKTPIRIQIIKVFQLFKFNLEDTGELARKLPVLTGKIAGNTILKVIIAASKDDAEEASDVAREYTSIGYSVLIVSDAKFPQTTLRLLNSQNIAVWRPSRIEEALQKYNDKEWLHQFFAKFFQEIGALDAKGTIRIREKIGEKGSPARVDIYTKYDAEKNGIISIQAICGDTGYRLFSVNKHVPLENYHINTLEIPQSAIITVKEGFLPKGVVSKNGKVDRGIMIPSLSAKDSEKHQIKDGFLLEKTAAVAKEELSKLEF